MTVRDAVAKTDKYKPNGYDTVQKITWLNSLDRKIFNDFILPRNPSASFGGYDETTDVETELLVPDDYAELYIYYLAAMIDFYNNETARYSNDMSMYNETYAAYARLENITDPPESSGNFIVI